MNPDTAPIAEVEAWLAPRLGWHALPDKPGWYSDGKGLSLIAGVLIGPSMDAAIACLPPGCRWACNLCDWIVYPPGPLDGRHIEHPRSGDPFAARDELLRLAAKAWMKMEENN